MINRTGLTYERDVIRRLPAVERSIRDFKNKQAIGIDSLATLISTTSLWTITLAPGDYKALTVQFTGSAYLLYQSELAVSTFVNNDANFAYRWPDGASLTTDLFALERRSDHDMSMSDEVGSGIKAYVITLKNTGTASKTIYHRYALKLPKGAVG